MCFLKLWLVRSIYFDNLITMIYIIYPSSNKFYFLFLWQKYYTNDRNDFCRWLLDFLAIPKFDDTLTTLVWISISRHIPATYISFWFSWNSEVCFRVGKKARKKAWDHIYAINWDQSNKFTFLIYLQKKCLFM